MRVLLGISISIIFHLLLVVFIQQLPAHFQSSKPLEVVIIEAKSQNKTGKQIVTAVDLPTNFKELPEDEQKALLSAYKQRVEKQMQAANNGATKNRSNSQKEEKPFIEKQEPNLAAVKLDPRKPGSLDVFQPTKVNPQNPNSNSQTKTAKSIPDLDKGLSTIGDALPTDIDIGSFTALNTNQSLFYTFYARVNDMIRFRWEMAVRASINQTPADHYVYNPLGVWTTHLEIILDKQGVVQQILLMKPSGFKDFDQAAIFAFRDSKAFFNPPKEMISPDDGLIHMKYSFQVRFDPKVLVKSRQ